jgi:hypothetical protein
MERNDPAPGRPDASLLNDRSLARKTATFALADLLGTAFGRGGRAAFDSPYALLRDFERWAAPGDDQEAANFTELSGEAVERLARGRDRFDHDAARPFLRYVAALDADRLVWASAQADTAPENRDAGRLPYEQTRGDWGSLKPEKQTRTRSRSSQGTLSGGGRASDKQRTRRGSSSSSSSSSASKKSPQRDLTEQYGDRDAGLDEYGIDVGEDPDPDRDDDEIRDARKRAKEEARRRGQYRRGESPDEQTQSSLTGDEAINRDLARNIEKSRRRNRERPESSLVDVDDELEQAGLDDPNLTEGERKVREAIENGDDDDDDDANGGGGR